MSRYSYTGVARSGSGKVIQGATVTLLLAGTNTPATFYAASTGSAVTSVTSDDAGQFVLWVSDADYSTEQQFRVKVQYPGGRFSANVMDNVRIIPIWVGPNTYFPDATEADQGSTGDNNTIKYYVDLANGDNATIKLRHSSTSATTTYTLTTSETIPSNITLKIESGAILDGIGTLTINGLLISGKYQIFGSNPTISGSPKVEKVYPEWWGAVGDGATDDSSMIQKAMNLAISAGAKLYFSGDKTYLIESGISSDLAQGFSELSGFGIVCDGQIKVAGGINGFTITNSYYCDYRMRFVDGGNESITYSAFNLVGGYHNKIGIEAYNYRGTVLEIENGLSSGAGGNGRIEITRLHTVNCYRDIYTHPSSGSTSQNAFGVILDWWSSNAYQWSLFASTQDVTIFQTNIDIGAVSGPEAGIYFTGCNSIRINHLAIGEIDDALSGDNFIVTFTGGGDLRIDTLYLLNETGASATLRKGLKLNNMDGVYIGARLNGIYNRAIEISGANSDNLNLNISADDCQSEVLYAQNDLGGSLDFKINSLNCADAGILHAVNLSQISCDNVTARFNCNNPNAVSDFLTAAQHYTYIDPSSRFTSGGTGVTFYPVAFIDQDATPKVGNGKFFKTANTIATTITNFDGAEIGHSFKLVVNDANTTIDFTGNVNLKGNGGADWSPSAGDWMEAIFDGTSWRCAVYEV